MKSKAESLGRAHTDAADDELTALPMTSEGGDLNHNTKAEDDRAPKDHAATAEFVAEEEGEDSTHCTSRNQCTGPCGEEGAMKRTETANFVDRNVESAQHRSFEYRWGCELAGHFTEADWNSPRYSPWTAASASGNVRTNWGLEIKPDMTPWS